jgi:hypothetical protein
MRHVALALAALALPIAATGCFSPDNPACAFQCGAFNNFDCPDSYTCNKNDGYCHLNGSSDPCPFVTGDGSLGGDGEIDMSMPPDLTGDDGGGDGPMSDDGGGDGSLGDGGEDMAGDGSVLPDLSADLTVLPDMTVLPDLTIPPDLTILPDLAISCGNGKQDGTETDVDCGGATCVGLGKTCAIGKGCQINADCASAVCDLGDGTGPGTCI